MSVGVCWLLEEPAIQIPDLIFRQSLTIICMIYQREEAGAFVTVLKRIPPSAVPMKLSKPCLTSPIVAYDSLSCHRLSRRGDEGLPDGVK